MHVSMAAVPLHGHVRPTLGLAAELVARGHRVTYSTTADFAPLVERTGAEVVAYRSAFPPTGGDEGRWMAEDHDGARSTKLFLEEIPLVAPQLAKAYANDEPDVVVHDTTALHAPELARRWGVPRVRISPTHVLPHDPETTPCLVTIPREFQVDAGRVGGHCRFVGPMPLPEPGRWTPPARPLALVSLGTVYTADPRFHRRAAAALAGAGWHVVLALGRFTDPAALGKLPESVEAHAWVPQPAVLDHADLFVTHGGMGGTMEALSRGVPLVVSPRAGDQFVTARRVVGLGLGAVLTADTGADLATAAAEATRPEVRERLARMRSHISRAGGAGAAADLVEARAGARTCLN